VAIYHKEIASHSFAMTSINSIRLNAIWYYAGWLKLSLNSVAACLFEKRSCIIVASVARHEKDA
jgi:hypothetical protein